MRGQVFGDVGPADDGLYDAGGVAAGNEGGGSDRCEVCGGPGGGFGAFNYDGIASEDGGYDWRNEVVKWIALTVNKYSRRRSREKKNLLPAHTSRNNTQWLPDNLILLIHHQEARRPPLSLQRLLPMINRPFQFLSRDQYLS